MDRLAFCLRAIGAYIEAAKRGELTPEDAVMAARYETAEATLVRALRDMGG